MKTMHTGPHHEDHMTAKDEERGSKTMLGMKQIEFDTKLSGGDGKSTRESVHKLGKVTHGNPNS